MWLSIILGVLVGLPLVLVAILSALPRDHLARMSIDLKAPPDRVWALVSDVGGTARWRSDIKGVEMQPVSGSRVRFVEIGENGRIPFEIVSQEPPRRQVVRVVDDDQPFGGTWTWELEAAGSGSRLVITEEGFVKNPLFWVLGKLFFSPAATIEAYLRALAKELGENAEPQGVAKGTVPFAKSPMMEP